MTIDSDGYVTCPRCNGFGEYYTLLRNGEIELAIHGEPLLYRCWMCDKTGQITWLESIFGIDSYTKIPQVPIEKSKVVTIDEYQQKYKTLSK